MTTVGFGDITPKTGLGRTIASLMMLIGWGTLAVPTGIVSAEFTALRMAGTAPVDDAAAAPVSRGTRAHRPLLQGLRRRTAAALTPGTGRVAHDSHGSAILRSFRCKNSR